MPWHIVSDHSECGDGRFAVVKDSDGSVEACHDTKGDAKKHMDALYAQESQRMTTVEQSTVTGLHTRVVELDDHEIVSRGKGGGDGRTVTAYAAVFESPAEILDQDGHYLEQHGRGAFLKTIHDRFEQRRKAGRHPLIGVFYNHGKTLYGTPSERYSVPLGVLQDIKEDGRGLLTVTRYDPTPVAEEVLEGIKSGSIGGMSYTGAYLRSDPEPPYYSRASGDLPLVTRQEVALVEIGPTPRPAYEDGPEVVGVRAQQQPDEPAREVIRVSTTATSDAPKTAADPPDADTAPTDAPGQGASSVSDTGQPVSVEDSTDEGTPAADGTGAADTAAEPAETTEEPQSHSKDNQERNAPMEPTSSAAPSAENQTMTVEERVARKSEIRARAAEIDNEFNGAVLPEDIQGEWDRIHVEYEQHSRAIEASLQRKEQLKRIAENPAATERADTGDTGGTSYRSRGMPATHTQTHDIYDVAEVRNRARSLDELPRLYRDNALRAVEIGRFPGVKSQEDAQSRAARLLNTVDDGRGDLARRILVTGSPVYERAFFKAVIRGGFMGLNGEEQRALTMGAADSAGLAVPFTLDPTIILTSDGSINPLRQIARVETITGKAWQGVTSAGITVSRAAEAAESTDNAPTLAQPEVTPTRVHGFVPFSIESDQDWSQLRSEMTRLLQDAKDTEEATSFVTGDGTGVNPDGIVAGLAAGQVTNVSIATGLSSDDLYGLEERLGPRFRSRAAFLAAKSTYNTIRQLDTAGGADLWVRLGAGMPNELIGYPAFEASAVGAFSGTNRFMVFGDFQTGFIIVDKAGMNVELIPHLFGTTANFPTGQRGLYAIWRNTSQILVDTAFEALAAAA